MCLSYLISCSRDRQLGPHPKHELDADAISKDILNILKISEDEFHHNYCEKYSSYELVRVHKTYIDPVEVDLHFEKYKKVIETGLCKIITFTDEAPPLKKLLPFSYYLQYDHNLCEQIVSTYGTSLNYVISATCLITDPRYDKFISL